MSSLALVPGTPEEWTATYGPFKSTPFAHQLEDLARSATSVGFGVFWEMGLGKSKLLIDTTAHLFRQRKLTGLLVIAPNGVHTNFVSQEVPPHMPDDVTWGAHTYHTDKAKTKRHAQSLDDLFQLPMTTLAILVMSYDAVCTDTGLETAKRFLKARRCMTALDESTAIKTPSSKRAKRVMLLGPLSAYRRVMDGTPFAEEPFDIYPQLRFLYPDYWKRHDMSSLTVFKQTFAIFKTMRAAAGHSYPQLLEYRNLDVLCKLTADVSCRRLKEECLDLPPKMYKRATFPLSTRQRELYDQLKRQTEVEVAEGKVMEATLAIVRLMRLQQITCGYVSAVDAPVLPEELIETPPATSEEAEERRRQILEWYQVELPMDASAVVHRASMTVTEEQARAAGLLGQGATFTISETTPNGDEIVHRGMRVEAIVEDREELERNGVRVHIASRVHEEDLTKSIVEGTWQHLEGDGTKSLVPVVMDIVPPEQNPRLQLLLQLIEQTHHKSIVFCRFRRDVDLICEALGDGCVRYDGTVKPRDREGNLAAFRDPTSKARVLVANIAALSRGVTLTIAKTVFYYSNTFSLIHRLQSEDRAHRIGQDQSVLYVDLVAEDTVDDHIVSTLREKFDIAAICTGDKLRAWL